jgi:hypothetical protein
MAHVPAIKSVDTADEYIHVRFRDPDTFDTIRTPDWAAHVARSVSEGSEVRMGRVQGEDDWQVESVLIDKHVGEDKAESKAKQIVEKIEN